MKLIPKIALRVNWMTKFDSFYYEKKIKHKQTKTDAMHNEQWSQSVNMEHLLQQNQYTNRSIITNKMLVVVFYYLQLKLNKTDKIIKIRNKRETQTNNEFFVK